MSSLRTLLRGLAPRVGSLRRQAPLSQSRGQAESLVELPRGQGSRSGAARRPLELALRGHEQSGPLPRGRRGSLALLLASRVAQWRRTSPASRLGSSPGPCHASPSGEWPSAPVGFERDWPPRGGTPVVIAMGGNVGDRVANFRMGLRLLRQVSARSERGSTRVAPASLGESGRRTAALPQVS